MKFFVTCARGTEGALRRELVALRIRAPKGDNGGCSFEGTFEQAMSVCLWSRVGVRVLWELATFPSPHADALYEGAYAVDWTPLLSSRQTLAVTATVHDNPELRHSGFVALKVKDAVVDSVRHRLGLRPDVNPEDPDVSLVLHQRGNEARLYADLAGEPLHKRGYRVAMTAAPLKETLAASVLALGGVPTEEPFIDPMCGSGTLAIEQALLARRIAPGLARARFGFQRWADQSYAAPWNTMRDQARSSQLARASAPILARDADPTAVEATRRNARAAGVLDDLQIELGAVGDLRPQQPPGTICTNPPYGERLGAAPDGTDGRDGSRPPRHRDRSDRRSGPPSRDRIDHRRAPASRPGRPAPSQHQRGPGSGPSSPEAFPDDPELRALYQQIARSFGVFQGFRIVLLTGNPLLSRIIGARPDISHRLYNGPLEVRLLRYQL